MEFSYAIPGIVVLVEWILAAAIYAVGWYGPKDDLNPVGDALAVAGVVTALVGIIWLAWSAPVDLALIQSSLASGLAVSALTIYAVLSRRRRERLSALAVLITAILIQAYAVGRLWLGGEAIQPEVFLPAWMVIRAVMGLAGYGGLVVATTLILLSFVLPRMKGTLPEDRLKAVDDLSTLEWQSLQIALVALSASLSVGLIRSWWGLGQVLMDGSAGALVTWLLLTAGVFGLMHDAVPPRLARVLLVLACLAGVVALLTMTGPLFVGASSLASTG
jgi:hypothetical protein